jgi:hypothetical protein
MNNPQEYPEIIYKYRNWTEEYHKDILIKNNLFMASPDYFNDPFDCRIPINYTLLDTPEKIEKYVVSFVERHKQLFLSRRIDLQEEINRMTIDYTNNIEQIQSNYEKILFAGQNQHYGVLSLSKRWDSILMWAHYAQNHRGFCVGFWEEKLRESRKFDKGGPVSYNPENEYPQIHPLTEDNEDKMVDKFKETHTKAFDWKYEEEYRINKLFYPEIPTNEDRIITIPDDFFAEITIGLMMPNEHKNEIIELARRKNIRVYQAKRIPFKFVIDREEIT